MPDSLHPPYGIFQPRVLQRWLDVNPQNGPLGRTRGQVVIPPFTIPVITFNQVSDKVFQLNFSSFNNFSFLMNSDFQTWIESLSINFCLFVVNIGIDQAKDVQGNNIVTRYQLSDIGVGNINAPLYEGQRIYGQHFQIEFWSRSTFTGFGFVSPNSVILLTSVRGNQDYRYGVDYPIHLAAPVQVSNFQNTNPNIVNTFNLPLRYSLVTINGIN